MLAAVPLALVAELTLAVAAEYSGTGCDSNRVSFNTSTLGGSSTTSKAFVDVPQARVIIAGLTLEQERCVAVHFSAVVRVPSQEAQLVVRAVLDGTTVAQPGAVILHYQGSRPEARSFMFVFPTVQPGNHTIQMQYKSATGGQVVIDRHTTVVFYP